MYPPHACLWPGCTPRHTHPPKVTLPPTFMAPVPHWAEEDGFMEEFRMLIGAGIKGQGGTALVYRTRDLLEGGWAGGGGVPEPVGRQAGA